MGQLRINHAGQMALIIACGLGQAISLASPANGKAYAWLQVFALALFLYTQQNNINNRKNFSQSWLFATVWLIASTWWLYISIHHFGGMPIWLTIAAIGLLCGSLALYYATSLCLYFKWKKNQ
jgi:apolipoprotein N-acyltransferase